MSTWIRGLFILFGLVILTSETSARPDTRRVRNTDAAALPSAQWVAVRCSANETRCWEQGLLAGAGGACHAPLAQGPCPQGQWLVLARDAASLRGRCAALLCPPDSRPPACRRRMGQAASACAQPTVHLDAKGHFACGQFPGRVEALHRLVRCTSTSTSTSTSTHSFATSTNGRRCAQTDAGQCSATATGDQPHIPLHPED